MSTFASPHNYGSYGYGYMSGAGTPERYSDLANRYAYRTKSYEPEVEEVASELNSEPVAVARRSLSDSYYTRKCKFLNGIYLYICSKMIYKPFFRRALQCSTIFVVEGF